MKFDELINITNLKWLQFVGIRNRRPSFPLSSGWPSFIQIFSYIFFSSLNMVHIKLQVSVVFIAAAAAIAPIVALPVEGTNYIRGIPDPDDQLFAHQAAHPGNLQDVQMEEHTDLADHWIHEDSSHGNKSPTSAPSSWVYVQYHLWPFPRVTTTQGSSNRARSPYW